MFVWNKFSEVTWSMWSYSSWNETFPPNGSAVCECELERAVLMNWKVKLVSVISDYATFPTISFCLRAKPFTFSWDPILNTWAFWCRITFITKQQKKRQKHGVRTESPSYFHSDCLTLFSSRLGITLWWCTVCAHTRSRALTFRGGDLTKARLNKCVLCDKLGHLLALSQR